MGSCGIADTAGDDDAESATVYDNLFGKKGWPDSHQSLTIGPCSTTSDSKKMLPLYPLGYLVSCQLFTLQLSFSAARKTANQSSI